MRFLIFTILLSQAKNSLSQDAALSDSPSGPTKIGEPCTRDYQCIRHAFCRVQSTCLCDPFYAPGPDMSTCHATAGLGCQSNEDCTTMANAECIQGVCTCKDNFILDITNSSHCIIRPVRDGDRCQRTDECIEAMDRSLCINGKCNCFTDFRYANETGKCVAVRGIYQPCRYNYECYDSKQPDALVCEGGSCEYKPGYGNDISESKGNGEIFVEMLFLEEDGSYKKASSQKFSALIVILGICTVFTTY